MQRLNDYAGAEDWRWRAIDQAKIDIALALSEIEFLLAKLAITHIASGEPNARMVRMFLRRAFGHLNGER